MFIPIVLISDKKEEINRFVAEKRKELQAIIIKIKPQKNQYSIQEIKEINREAHVFHQQVRIYLLEEFHLSSLEAQNAFLKLLEEPPTNTQFILTTPSIHLLLPTVISRTKVIRFISKKEEKSNQLVMIKIEKLINLAKSKLSFSSFNFNDKDSAVNFLDNLIIFFKKKLLEEKNSHLILKEVLKVKNLLENNNLNPQIAIDHLLIFIYYCYNANKR